MIRLDDGRYIIGFDDGYQLGKTANFIFDNGGQYAWERRADLAGKFPVL